MDVWRSLLTSRSIVQPFGNVFATEYFTLDISTICQVSKCVAQSLAVLCQRTYEIDHFHTSILVPIDNELTRKKHEKLFKIIVFRIRNTIFSVWGGVTLFINFILSGSLTFRSLHTHSNTISCRMKRLQPLVKIPKGNNSITKTVISKRQTVTKVQARKRRF